MSEHDEEVDDPTLFVDLHKYMEEIYTREPMSKERYMFLYHKTYECCIQCWGEAEGQFYKSKVMNILNRVLNSEITVLLKVYLENLRKQMDNLIEEDLLNQYIKLWEEYRFSSKVFSGVCSYLNRQWHIQRISNDPGIFDVYQLSLFMWRDTVCKYLSVQIKKIILKLIERDRCGDPINTRLVSEILNCYVELGLDKENPYSKELVLDFYRNEFESAFLKETERFYVRESSDFILKNPFSEYMKKVKERLQEEDKRAEICLHISTKAPLIKICEKVLIVNHLDSFISEFINMSVEDRLIDLNIISELLSRIPNSFPQLSVILENHIKTEGLSAIQKVADDAINNPKLVIQTIFDICKKYINIVMKIFKADEIFNSVDKACISFINYNVLTSSESDKGKLALLLARYYDLLLKKSSNNLEEEELDNALCQAKIVLIYIEDKDVFVKYYIRLLAKRLIFQNSVSDDAEMSMITQFKEICRYEDTRKLQRMFQDMQVSKDFNEKFKKHLKNSDTPSVIDFSVRVLTSVFWPLKQSILFSLPPELEYSIQTFTHFFSTEHSRRKLQWLYYASRGEICTNCFKNSYVFQVSTFQIAVLLQFNNSLSLTLQQLQEATQMEMEYLIQVIQILLKVKLLVHDKKEELTASSNLKLFTGYNNKKLRVNINFPLKIEQKIEQKAAIQDIEGERKTMIQAAIVRIMKMRKTLKHQDLVMEICNQLDKNFKPSVAIIKKNIDILIGNEYLERAKGERDLYIYLG